MVRGILKRCDQATLEFALEHLYQWPIERFWSKAHRSLVGMNLQLPLSASGAGLIPQQILSSAAYAASWLQPALTIAETHGISEEVLIQEWNSSTTSQSIQSLRDSLGLVKGGTDLLTVHQDY
jgi:hypothetical protein